MFDLSELNMHFKLFSKLLNLMTSLLVLETMSMEGIDQLRISPIIHSSNYTFVCKLPFQMKIDTTIRRLIICNKKKCDADNF